MRPEELSQLLYEEEGPSLDFKRDQYPFSKATDEEKSEILKDILGFVNCWRRTEACIVIGVEDVRGGRGVVHGIVEHLADHSLQQFVNNLTNRPIQFRYDISEIDGKQVGIIRVEIQRRPVFLKRDYGKLKKGEVYVRRGSSTDPNKPADPDEIAMMGAGPGIGLKEASLSVGFAALEQEQHLGEQIEWSAEFCEMPEQKKIPKLGERPNQIDLPGGRSFQIPNLSSLDIHNRLNPQFYRQLAVYEFVHRLYRKVRLVVCNTGDGPANEVRLEIVIPTDAGMVVVDSSDIPSRPKRSVSAFGLDPNLYKVRRPHREAGDVEIDKNDHHMKIEIECGNLQPGRKVWSETFWVGIGQSGVAHLSGHLFAANLPVPQAFGLTINANVSQTTISVKQLMSMEEPDDDMEE